MTVVEGLIGSETSGAKRVRNFRKRKALQSNDTLQSNPPVTSALHEPLHVTLQRNGEIEIEKEIEKEIYVYWQKQPNLLTLTIMKPHTDALLEALKSYSKEEIMRGIKRYNRVINLKDTLFPYKWTLKDFLSKGLHRFVEDGLTEKDFVSQFGREEDSGDKYLKNKEVE